MELIFNHSKKGKRGVTLPAKDVPVNASLDARYLRQKPARLPNVSEPEVVRHFTRLSKLNFGVDSNFYPLGSCTMKYNPKFTEKVAALPGFSEIHPLSLYGIHARSTCRRGSVKPASPPRTILGADEGNG